MAENKFDLMSDLWSQVGVMQHEHAESLAFKIRTFRENNSAKIFQDTIQSLGVLSAVSEGKPFGADLFETIHFNSVQLTLNGAKMLAQEIEADLTKLKATVKEIESKMPAEYQKLG